MKKIPVNKLLVNFSKLILDIFLQLAFTLLILTITGILAPYTYHSYAVALVAQSIAYAIMACNIYIFSAYQANRLNMRNAINDLNETITNNLTAKNVMQAALKRIVTGVAVGIMSFSFSAVSIVIMYFAFPKQFAVDMEKLEEMHNDSDLTRTTIAVHAPVVEEALYRSLQMSLLKIALYSVYVLYSAVKDFISSPTEEPTVAIAARTGDGIEQPLTADTPTAVELEQEQKSIEVLNNRVDNSANFFTALSFSKGHLPTQYPHTFVSGLAYGNLTNQYGDIVASVAAHMTHNTLSTLRMD